jgi:hypothetical protein
MTLSGATRTGSASAAAIERGIGELRAGHAVLVVDSTDAVSTDATAQLEHLRESA